MSRFSGLARDSLSLYRTALRAIRQKTTAEAQGSLRLFAREEFERHRQIPVKNFQLIEHLLRKGHKQVALMRSASVTGMNVSEGKN
jgi:succinate dehydrogenase assembly factor 1